MVILFTCILVMLIGVFYLLTYMKYDKNAKSLICSGNVLEIKDIVLFSNVELARKIKKALCEANDTLEIFYFNGEAVLFDGTYTIPQILYKIEMIQDFLINERYTSSTNSAAGDCIDKKMLDIWLDYGYKENYRTIFRREMNRMLKYGEISNSTFNRMYYRFYKFDRSEYTIGRK